MSRTQRVSTVAQLRELLTELRQGNRTIGLVPTMGALHQGHLSLAEQSLAQSDWTIASIFVNPTQFAPDEDLDAYPRTLERDLKLLSGQGVHYAFIPEPSEIYPDGFSTSIQAPAVAERLEGEYRPTHFSGVCTVVLKLFNLVQPDLAFFGQKDFQQVAVIKQMVRDLDVPVEIVTCPIIREPSGLALSSRNVYLSPVEHRIAQSLYRTLQMVRQAVENEGRLDGQQLMLEMRQMLMDSGISSIDYAVLADPETLVEVNTIQSDVVALIACHVGSTRLIDNCLVSVSPDTKQMTS